MNWHQQNAIRQNYQNRKLKAHVTDSDRYGFYALCGQHRPSVTVDKNSAHLDHNNTCKRCLALLESE